MATYSFPSAAQAANMDINAIVGGLKDRGAWPYYDKIYLALSGGGGTTGAVSQSYIMFSTPVGTADPVIQVAKTRTQTNMISSGNQLGFGPTRALIMEAIGFQFPSSLSKPNVDLIVNNCFFQFQIAEKVFYEGTLNLWPGGYGMFGVTTATGEETWTNGMPNPHGMRRFGIEFGKYLAPTVPFTLTLTFTATPTLTFPLGSSTPGAILNPISGNYCVPILEGLLDGLTDREIQ